MPDLSPELEDLKQRVVRSVEYAEKTSHRDFKRRSDHFWALWRSYQDLRGSYDRTDRRDRDRAWMQAQREWGSTLFIPFTFAIVETVLPRIVANRPRMLVLPRTPASDQNVENMRFLIDAQQDQIDYELKLQTTIKTALITGLGVQKSLWRKSERKTKRYRRRTLQLPGLSEYVEEPYTEMLFDDPDAEDVDPLDWFWAPTATGKHNLEWAAHRTWRSTSYILGKIQSGTWDLMSLTAEDLKSSGQADKYTETHNYRRQTAGYSKWDPNTSSDQQWEIHEVLEFHDGQQVITVVDRQWPVAKQDYMVPGDIPFHVYRPTEVPGSMVGIGEPEAIEDLQIEMNTLRTQRRDNATIKLMQTYAFNDGAVDPADIKLSPGGLIPVNGEPKDLLMPLQVGDIPNSGYMEEQHLAQDIERTSGISDTVQGASSGPAETATGTQLMVAAANARIQLKTRRAELELCKEQTRQFGRMNQVMITSRRDVRIPNVPKPGEPDRRWAWRQLGPDELAGEFEYVPDGGSTAPTNVQQDRVDAQLLLTILAPLSNIVDSRKIVEEALRKMGFQQPQMFMAPDQSVPPQTLDILAQMLVGGQDGQQANDPQEVQQMIQAALDQARQMQEQADQAGAPAQAPPTGQEPAKGQGVQDQSKAPVPSG